jgi:hypothetical protein
MGGSGIGIDTSREGSHGIGRGQLLCLDGFASGSCRRGEEKKAKKQDYTGSVQLREPQPSEDLSFHAKPRPIAGNLLMRLSTGD